jgi:hypothetical protein
MLQELIHSGREYIVASYIQGLIKEYADVVNVTIDREKSTMEFKVRLLGETEITIATVIGYKVFKDSENTYFRYEEFKTSKPWVNKVVENFSTIVVKDKQFYIPNKMLQKVLPLLLK